MSILIMRFRKFRMRNQSDTAEKIESCPFCGRTDKLEVKTTIEKPQWSFELWVTAKIRCEQCGISRTGSSWVKGSQRPEDFINAIKESEREAIYVWNRRGET